MHASRKSVTMSMFHYNVCLVCLLKWIKLVKISELFYFLRFKTIFCVYIVCICVHLSSVQKMFIFLGLKHCPATNILLKVEIHHPWTRNITGIYVAMRWYISMLVEKCWLMGCLLSPQSFPLTKSCRKIPLPFNSIVFPLPGDRKTVGKFHWWPMRVEIFNPHCRNSSEYLALLVKKIFRPPDTWVLRHPVRLADLSVNSFYSALSNASSLKITAAYCTVNN